jgi:hypothetical protein
MTSLPLDQLTRFKAENKELKAEIQQLKLQQQNNLRNNQTIPVSLDLSDENFPTSSEVGSSANPLTTSSSIPSASTFADPVKYNQKLKKLFQEQVAAYKKAVLLLTGYEVLMNQVNNSSTSHRIKLRSIYAANADDYVIFQVCFLFAFSFVLFFFTVVVSLDGRRRYSTPRK